MQIVMNSARYELFLPRRVIAWILRFFIEEFYKLSILSRPDML
jgi:hypothetical protein